VENRLGHRRAAPSWATRPARGRAVANVVNESGGDDRQYPSTFKCGSDKRGGIGVLRVRDGSSLPCQACSIGWSAALLEPGEELEMSRFSSFGVRTVLCALLVHAAAQAAPDAAQSGDRVRARTLYGQGEKLFKSGDTQGAQKAFEEA